MNKHFETIFQSDCLKYSDDYNSPEHQKIYEIYYIDIYDPLQG